MNTLQPFDAGGPAPVEPFSVDVGSVALTVQTQTLEVGTAGSAFAVVDDAFAALLAGRSVTWTSSNDAVIADPASSITGVDGRASAVLTALAAGTTTIAAHCEGVDSAGIVVAVVAVASPPGYSATGSAKVIINAVSAVKRMGRGQPRRFGDADQRKIDPTDTSFSRVADNVERSIVWPNRELLKRYV